MVTWYCYGYLITFGLDVVALVDSWFAVSWHWVTCSIYFYFVGGLRVLFVWYVFGLIVVSLTYLILNLVCNYYYLIWVGFYCFF